ncbi:MAG: MBL fold metallo-hydrolase [Polaribacter sp.]|nr:MBL fold metallo-hydrolase [Polaribacter sp.]
MKIKLCLLILSISLFSFNYENKKDTVKITPISHATAVISFENEIIYLDPTGGAIAFSKFEKPTYVLITDVHGDHLNMKTLNELDLTSTTIIAPKAVADQLQNTSAKEIIIINNGEHKKFANFSVEAIPMYNLREEALKFHTKGRGNGYVVTINKERIYFSGDTEDIPEMRNLKNIDKAFVCMNLPYTMTIENAADAVLAFKPKEVYPYHYRGTEGLSDVEKFKEIVTKKNKAINVVQLDWYPKN